MEPGTLLQIICLLHFFNLFTYGWAGSLVLRAGFLSSCSKLGFSSLWCTGFSLKWLLLLQSTGFTCTGFSSRSTWAQ